MRTHFELPRDLNNSPIVKSFTTNHRFVYDSKVIFFVILTPEKQARLVLMICVFFLCSFFYVHFFNTNAIFMLSNKI